MSQNKYFVLYSNCIPVNGASRSLICDVQNAKYYFIPNNLYSILKDELGKNIKVLYSKYGESNKIILDEYFTFLINNQLGFFDDEPDLFPNLNLDWNLPSLITNAQIDIDNSYFKKDRCTRVLTELSEMNCECIEIRSFSIIKPSIINHMLEVTQDSRIKELRFILHFDKEIEQLFQEELICQHSRINSITFHNSKINDTKKIKGVNIFYLEDKLDSSKCGQVCSSAFTINIENFTESINFNNCLNRKVAIDSNGNIKNCGSQEESFGNVNELSLTEAINNSRFQKLWHVRKDDIEVCKDCEFRYICTDCRIFKNDSNDIYSKPKKCNYDPYTNTWA